MFFGKRKALTFSYDDGVEQDKKLIELFRKYGMKATFNINSGLMGSHLESKPHGYFTVFNRIPAEEIAETYKGFEVASHTTVHPNMQKLSEEEVIRVVEDDRATLSRLVGYDVIGFAYPFGRSGDDVEKTLVTKTGVRYARTVNNTHSFDLQSNLMCFNPTVYHREWDWMFKLAEQFLNSTREGLFYVWGHSYELDWDDNWKNLEEFLKMLSGHDDICYETNRALFGV